MDEELIAAHREVPTLMPFLHLPVQSGSDRILAAMNRRHTRGRLSAADLERLRAARPDLALSSDFIVGHPGETEARFRRDAGAGARRSASPRRSASNTRRAPARRPPARRPGAGGGEGPRGCTNCRRCCARSRPLQRRLRRPRRCRCCSPGPAAIPARSPGARPTCSRCTSTGPAAPDRHRIARCGSPPPSPTLCPATLSQERAGA